MPDSAQAILSLTVLRAVHLARPVWPTTGKRLHFQDERTVCDPSNEFHHMLYMLLHRHRYACMDRAGMLALDRSPDVPKRTQVRRRWFKPQGLI